MMPRIPENTSFPANGALIWLFRMSLMAAICGTVWFAFTPNVHPGIDQVWDKLNHAAAFYVLALLLDFSLPQTRFGARKFLVLIGYGAMIEGVQYFLPYRQASWLDLSADAVGIVAYLVSVPLLASVPLLRKRWRVSRQTS